MDNTKLEIGGRLAQQARDAADMANEPSSIQEDEDRNTYSNYQVIVAAIGLVKGTSVGIENIKYWQSLWAEGGAGDGSSGEILTRLSGLLDIEPEELLNPGEKDLKDKLSEQAQKKVTDGSLASFIAKNIESIKKSNQDYANNVKSDLAAGSREMTAENIQFCLERLTERQSGKVKASLVQA